MKYDKFGRAHTNTYELVELLYQNPDLDVNRFFVTDPYRYNDAIKSLYVDFPKVRKYEEIDELTVEQFDGVMQKNWYMPEEYMTMDIAQWILDQCKTQAELQRVGEELLLFQERDLFNLLKYMKYMVDTFRKNGIVWGVGRGSSVASYVLYLIGVHKINSLYYDIPIEEFLK
jgi:DNA polymerase III alpha subunit